MEPCLRAAPLEGVFQPFSRVPLRSFHIRRNQTSQERFRRVRPTSPPSPSSDSHPSLQVRDACSPRSLEQPGRSAFQPFLSSFACASPPRKSIKQWFHVRASRHHSRRRCESRTPLLLCEPVASFHHVSRAALPRDPRVLLSPPPHAPPLPCTLQHVFACLPLRLRNCLLLSPSPLRQQRLSPPSSSFAQARPFSSRRAKAVKHITYRALRRATNAFKHYKLRTDTKSVASAFLIPSPLPSSSPSSSPSSLIAAHRGEALSRDRVHAPDPGALPLRPPTSADLRSTHADPFQFSASLVPAPLPSPPPILFHRTVTLPRTPENNPQIRARRLPLGNVKKLKSFELAAALCTYAQVYVHHAALWTALVKECDGRSTHFSPAEACWVLHAFARAKERRERATQRDGLSVSSLRSSSSFFSPLESEWLPSVRRASERLAAHVSTNFRLLSLGDAARVLHATSVLNLPDSRLFRVLCPLLPELLKAFLAQTADAPQRVHYVLQLLVSALAREHLHLPEVLKLAGDVFASHIDAWLRARSLRSLRLQKRQRKNANSLVSGGTKERACALGAGEADDAEVGRHAVQRKQRGSAIFHLADLGDGAFQEGPKASRTSGDEAAALLPVPQRLAALLHAFSLLQFRHEKLVASTLRLVQVAASAPAATPAASERKLSGRLSGLCGGAGRGVQVGRKDVGNESCERVFSGSVSTAREGQGASRFEVEERRNKTTHSVGSPDETLATRRFRDLSSSSSPASQQGNTDRRLPLSRMYPSTSRFVTPLPAANCTSLLPSPASSAQVPVHRSGSALTPRSDSVPTSLSCPRKTPRSPASLQHVHPPWSGEAAAARALLLAPHALMRGGRGTGRSPASVSAAAVSVQLSRFGFSRGRKRRASETARRGAAHRLKRADWRRMLHVTLASHVPPGRRSPFSTRNLERDKQRAALLERHVAARRAATAASTCRKSETPWTASQLGTVLAALDAIGVKSQPLLELWQRAVYVHLHALPFHETVEALDTASRLGWYSRAFGRRAFARVDWFLKTEKSHTRSMEDFCRVAEILSAWPGGETEVHEATRAVRRRLARLGREWLLDDAGEAALRDVWRALVRLGHVPPPSSPLLPSRWTSAASDLLLSTPSLVAKCHPPSPSKSAETPLIASSSPSSSSEPCREGQTVETPGGETGDSSAHRASPSGPPSLTAPSVSSAERLSPARLSSSLSSSSLLGLSGSQRCPLRRVAACSGCAPQRLALQSVAGVVPWRPVEAIYREAVGVSLIPALLRITVSLFPLSPPIPLTLLLPRVRKCALAGVLSLGSLHCMLKDLNALRQFRSLAAHIALRPASGQPRRLSPSAARLPPLHSSLSRDGRSIDAKGVSGEHEETRENRVGDENQVRRFTRTPQGLSSSTALAAVERVSGFPIQGAVSGASERETDASRPMPDARTRSTSCTFSSEAAECAGEAQTTAAGTQRHEEDSWKTREKERLETFEELLEETEAALWRVTRQRVCRALTRRSAEPVQQRGRMHASGKASSLGSACLQTRLSRMQATAGAVSLEDLASHGALLHGFSNSLGGELVDSGSLRLGRGRAVETPESRGSSALTLGSFGKASETSHGRPQPPPTVEREQGRVAFEGSGRLDTTTQCLRTKATTEITDTEMLEVLAAVRETVRGSWPQAERQSRRKHTPGPSGDEAEEARDVLSIQKSGETDCQEIARGWQFQSVGEAAAVLALEVAPYISKLLRPEPCGYRRPCLSSLRRGDTQVRSSLSVLEACAAEKEDRGRETERSARSPEASSLSWVSTPSAASLQSHWRRSLEAAEEWESRAKSARVSEQGRHFSVENQGSLLRAEGLSGCHVAWEPARDILGRLVHFFSSFSQMATAKEVRQTLHIVLGFLRHPVWLCRLESHLSAALQGSWEATACARRCRSDSVSIDLCFEWELDVLEHTTAIGAALLRQQPRSVAATRADELLVLFADLQGTARQIRRVFQTAVEGWWSARGASEENGEPTCSDRCADDFRHLARNRIQTIDMLFGNTLQFLQLAENVMVECMYTRLRDVPSLALAASPVTALNATLEACSPWLGSGDLGVREGRGSGEGKRKETCKDNSERFAGKAAHVRGASTCNKSGGHTPGEASCEVPRTLKTPRELKTEEQAGVPAGHFTDISEEGHDVSGILALRHNPTFRRRLEQLSFLSAAYPQAFSACSRFCEEGVPLPVETHRGFAQPACCPDTRHSSAFHALPSFLSTQHGCAGPAAKKTEGTATPTARGTCEKRSLTEEGQAEKQSFSCSQLVNDVVWATLESEREKCTRSFGERKSWGGTPSGEGRDGQSRELHKERTRASLARTADWLVVMQRLRESPENAVERNTFEDLRWHRPHLREGVRTEENWRHVEKGELSRFVTRLFVLRMLKQDAALARILDGLWVSR